MRYFNVRMGDTERDDLNAGRSQGIVQHDRSGRGVLAKNDEGPVRKFVGFGVRIIHYKVASFQGRNKIVLQFLRRILLLFPLLKCCINILPDRDAGDKTRTVPLFVDWSKYFSASC